MKTSVVPDEGALLQQLSAQVQWDVLAVDHTCARTHTHTRTSTSKVKLSFINTMQQNMEELQKQADLGGSATTWAECLWLWSGSGPSGCTEPHWSPSPCSRQTCSASVDTSQLTQAGGRNVRGPGRPRFKKKKKPRTPHRVGDVEDASDVERSVGSIMERVAGLVIGLGDVAVELLVLPVADFFWFHHPQGLMGNGVKT